MRLAMRMVERGRRGSSARSGVAAAVARYSVLGLLRHRVRQRTVHNSSRGLLHAWVIAEHVDTADHSPAAAEYDSGGVRLAMLLEETATHAMVSFVRARGLDLSLAPSTLDQLHMESYELACESDSGVGGTMLVAGARVSAEDGAPTAVLAVVAHLVDEAGVLQRAQVRAHWACTKGPGQGWRAPPSGWHTQPSQSHDAGGGAWQTLLEPVRGLERGMAARGGLIRTMVLQVPLAGPLSHASSALALVLTTDRGQWLKAVVDSRPVDVSFPVGSLSQLLSERHLGSPAATPRAPPLPPPPPPPQPAAPARFPAPDTLPPPPPPAASDAQGGGAGNFYSPFAAGDDEATGGRAAAAAAATGLVAPIGADPAGASWDLWDAKYSDKGMDEAVWERRLWEMRAAVMLDAGAAAGLPEQAAAPVQAQAAQETGQTARRGSAAGVQRPKRAVTPQVAQLGVTDAPHLERFIAGFSFHHRAPSDFTVGGDVWQSGHVCGWMVDSLGHREPTSQRSLMHRFNEASEMVDQVAGVGDWGEQQAALLGVAVWLRLSAMRLLPWNRNYNIKPREISAAQDRLCSQLSVLWAASGRGQVPELRPLVRLALTSVGRGGQGDVGQRVRDEILEVQQRNHCKGGMMEEWHQKLHNNTSPDDVVICEALLNYCRKGLDIGSYWQTLHQANINAERLASFDRPIRSEPRFTPEQVPGLVQDLTTYLHTLRAVHCGTDLASAASNVLGYRSRDLKGHKIAVEPVPHVASAELRTLLAAALHLQHVLGTEGTSVADGQDEPHALHGTVRLMELLVEARHLIRHAVLGGDQVCGGRHRDVIFLDMALESALRSALEAALSGLRAAAAAAAAAPPSACDSDYLDAHGNGGGQVDEVAVVAVLDQVEEGVEKLLPALSRLALRAPACGGGGSPTASQRLSLLLAAMCLALEGAALSSFPNEDLTAAMKWLTALHGMQAGELQRDRALQALSVFERLKRTLDNQSSALAAQLQPTAEAMGHRLGLPHHAVAIFSEEVVRGTAAAPLAQLLGVLEPCLRRLVGSGDWQVVSRGAAERAGGVLGVLRHHHGLEEVQYHAYGEPTVLLVDNIGGHEEVPAGCVAVMSTHGQCPDMLAHSAVRARNMDVLLAACHNGQVAEGIKHMVGGQVRVVLSGQEVQVTRA